MLAVFELNDQMLLAQAENGPFVHEPGFARLSPGGIETGEAARAAAWREPQHSFNQYWCHLSQKSLPGKHKWARHHADIAFAQLRKLWQGAGSAESLVILAPGSFSDAQISLLLGMVKALPAETVAIVDSALSACLNLNRDTVFVDLQLHQTVLSVCRVSGELFKVVEQVVVPDLGMMQIYNRVTRHISNMLIRSFRYDPLHASASEQNLCNLLPAWLGRLSWEQELSLSVSSDQGELPFILRREDVQNLLREPMAKMRSMIDLYRNHHLAFSWESRLLAGMFEEFSTAYVARQSAGIEHVLSHQRQIFDQITSLQRVRSLALDDIESSNRPDVPRLATHLLYLDTALPLQMPLGIRIRDGGVQMANRVDENADLTLVLKNQALEVLQHAPGLKFSVPKNCQPGELLEVGGYQMKLIEVHHGSQ